MGDKGKGNRFFPAPETTCRMNNEMLREYVAWNKRTQNRFEMKTLVSTSTTIPVPRSKDSAENLDS